MTDQALIRDDEDPGRWFDEHFDRAAEEVLSFLGDAGVSLEGKAVADVGCGDGIIDLGLAVKGRPRMLVGYDLRPTDVDALRRAAAAAGAAEQLPEALSFTVSEPARIPAENGAFDVVVTWSVFEHVDQPEAMLAEAARVLKPDGVLFLQLWPFFFSEHGGHLWPHYDEGFPHLLNSDETIRDRIRGRRGTDATRSDAVEEYESLNRVTVDDLHRALLSAGLIVTKLELLTGAVHIPRRLAHLPLSAVGISGVKLLAIRAHPEAGDGALRAHPEAGDGAAGMEAGG